MSYILPIYGMVLMGAALAFVLYAASRSDSTRQRKWAKVRVWVDDNRKNRMPPAEDLDAGPRIDWLVYAALFLLIILMLDAAT